MAQLLLYHLYARQYVSRYTIVCDSPTNIQALLIMIEGHSCKNNEANAEISSSGVISPAANLIITNASMQEKTFTDTDCLAHYKNIPFE